MRFNADPHFASFFWAGFECSTHRRLDGVRLDLVAATRHDIFVRQDFEAAAACGMRVAREGVRWHLVEAQEGRFDWSSVVPMIRASRDQGIELVWDLLHYGWPDHIDIWSPSFPTRFARFSAAFATLLRDELGHPSLFCPINEISYFAWAGAEVARMEPGASQQGGALKRQLVRAAAAACDAIRVVDRRARFICAEPLVHVAEPADPSLAEEAQVYNMAQFEAVDMLIGREEPTLGGQEDFLDFVGVNFYPDNQWYLHGSTIPMGHHAYRPLCEMLENVCRRYERPLVLTETGAEGRARPYWLHYVAGEVVAAIAAGVPVEGVCLYPIIDYPGWDNERVCHVGLLSAPDRSGRRVVYRPLLEEMQEAERQVIRARGRQDANGILTVSVNV